MNRDVLLIVGATVLLLGSVALLLVRVGSPRLRGTAWLSVAFAAGSLGSGLILVQGQRLCIPGVDLSLLTSFVLFHIAVQSLFEKASVPLWRGCALLGVQASVDLLAMTGHATLRHRIISIGILVALQCAATCALLWPLARQRVRAPALFTVAVLIVFGLFNLVRSAVELLASRNYRLNQEFTVAAFAMFIAEALGMAFGFFWLTTETLTAELEHMAATDPLTRLYNRRVFLRWCHKELGRSQRSGLPFSVLIVDLDHFKAINDNFGHAAGDEVLCSAVEQMQDSVRGIDVLCRWGGEEFAVLLPGAGAGATAIVAERIRANMQRVKLSAGRSSPREPQRFLLTASVGTATYRDLGDSFTEMLDRADRALYEAKQSGRNRVLAAS